MKEQIRFICDRLEELGFAYDEYQNLLVNQSKSSVFECGFILGLLNDKFDEINRKLCEIGRG